MVINILPIYRPNQAEKDDCMLYANNFRENMLKSMPGINNLYTNRHDAYVLWEITKLGSKFIYDNLCKMGKQFLVLGGNMDKRFGSKLVSTKQSKGWFRE